MFKSRKSEAIETCNRGRIKEVLLDKNKKIKI